MLREPERVDQAPRQWPALPGRRRAAAGLDVATSWGYAVTPVIVGDSLRTVVLANRLLARGINAFPIIPPGVPEKSARLRFFISASHSEEDIDIAVAAVSEELNRLIEERGLGGQICGVDEVTHPLRRTSASLSASNPHQPGPAGITVITGPPAASAAAVARRPGQGRASPRPGGRNAERLNAVAESCRALGAECDVGQVDLRDRAALQAFLAEVERRGPIELFISNAGILDGRRDGAPVEDGAPPPIGCSTSTFWPPSTRAHGAARHAGAGTWPAALRRLPRCLRPFAHAQPIPPPRRAAVLWAWRSGRPCAAKASKSALLPPGYVPPP